ncbi:hypothetical protein J6590_015261 [Homalodisca vitripennis]|nr:hypothetical protein J6590_015261 [Homalodisca vitripennis]
MNCSSPFECCSSYCNNGKCMSCYDVPHEFKPPEKIKLEDETMNCQELCFKSKKRNNRCRIQCKKDNSISAQIQMIAPKKGVHSIEVSVGKEKMECRRTCEEKDQTDKLQCSTKCYQILPRGAIPVTIV